MLNSINTFNEAKIQLMRLGIHGDDAAKLADIFAKLTMMSNQHNRLIDILQRQFKVLEMEDTHGITVDSTGKGVLGLASSTTDGALSSADWGTFTGKQNQSNELDALSALADTVGVMRKTGDGAYSIDTTIDAIYTDTSEPTGFVTGSEVLSWDDGTLTLTITGAHVIYVAGVRYAKTTTTKPIADTTGLHYIYYASGGTLTESTDFPGFNVCLIAFVYWNTTINKGMLSDERHGITMDHATHDWAHDTIGVRYHSGLTGTFTDTTFSVTAGYISDEDLSFHITPDQTLCHVLYKNGSSSYEWDADQTAYYKLNGANLRYNNVNALADVGSNNYVAYWIFATNIPARPIVSIMGQRTDVTIAAARANNTYQSLSLGTLPSAEMKLLYRVILRNDATPYEEIQDLRSVSNLPSGTYTATSHAALTSLDYASAGHTGFLPDTAIDDTAYGASWDTITTIAPSKNAVYDIVSTLGTGSSSIWGYM